MRERERETLWWWWSVDLCHGCLFCRVCMDAPWAGKTGRARTCRSAAAACASSLRSIKKNVAALPHVLGLRVAFCTGAADLRLAAIATQGISVIPAMVVY
jgi:hypothetical protein